MSISRDYISRVAKNFLGLLEERKIDSASDLERLLDKKISFTEDEFVMVELRPSMGSELAYTVSYYTPLGVPLEMKINQELRYAKLIVKSDHDLDGYRNFYYERTGNSAKMRELDYTDMPKLKEELKKLL